MSTSSDRFVRFLRCAALAFAVGSVSTSALAGPKPATPTPAQSDEKTEQAGKLFNEGVEAVKKFQWAEALSAFEQSAAIIPNANTTLNIGVCERALGRYVRAQRSFEHALAENDQAGGNVLSASSVGDAKSYLKEASGLIVHANVTVVPVEAAIAVDGRPIASLGEGQPFAAGVEPAGEGRPAPAPKFELVLDPGAHVFVLSRKGFSDAVVNKTLAPGSSLELSFELEKLPATLKISADAKGAIVQVGKVDVGPVPVDVLRPAGSYPVVVQKEGFDTYETNVTIRAGEETKINAVLPKTKLNVAKQWWFWTSIAGALGTAGVITYFATRPAPKFPAYQGGTTGWVVGTTATTHF